MIGLSLAVFLVALAGVVWLIPAERAPPAAPAPAGNDVIELPHIRIEGGAQGKN